MANDLTLGIDLGGTNIKAVWIDADGNLVKRDTRSTSDTDSGQAWKEAIREMADGSAARIGLAAPGLAEGSRISFMPGRLHGLEGFNWAKFLGKPVRVVNDAHAALLGEVARGAAQGKRNAVMLTLGTGVGGAVFAEGQLLRGGIGRAGHLGHITVNHRGKADIVGTPGSLEDAVGDCTVRERTGFASTRELVAAANAGDTKAQAHWDDTVHALAAGVASLINAFDPELIVLGGGITSAGDALLQPLSKHLATMEWRPAGHAVPIVPATLAEWAGAFGAAWYAEASS